MTDPQHPDTATDRPDPAEHARWVAVADRVAAQLSSDVVARDRSGAAPHKEVELLRDAGLLPLLIPARNGGHGGSWLTAFEVVTRVGRADTSIGHVLGYHYLHNWRTRLARRLDVVERLATETAANNWLWGGAGNPRDAGLELEPTSGGYLVRGKKFFATGAEVSDRVIASGTDTVTGQKYGFALPTRTAGVVHGEDWDSLGQRASASGSIAFDGAFLAEEDILGPGEQTDPDAPAYPSLSALGFQILLGLLAVATAEGALRFAAEYTRTKSRAWATSGVAEAADDPLVRVRYGELESQVRAARALTDRAGAAWMAAASRGWELTHAERGEVSVELSAVKVVTTRAALDATQGVFELTGARATKTGTGLDRYWRDVRTLTLHDPVSHKAIEVGDHLLRGAYPEPSGYS
ncbi:acyl-CoA dehydrogenase family protein [Cryptosporangium arvum]|uniref:Acyl-CoA dehydrogenase n=1 Tax=Cryptosporangium arvum DSM 44712 TaxID=927661 RepID=A0A010YHQ5_9ACTN|nr:acyl-CoA dehydrogenase family protein [Cryptosporangium arvum]EXG79790.1 acyl-CoA dehydrogenase [Cryptosporangium arvum DSM 44712]